MSSKSEFVNVDLRERSYAITIGVDLLNQSGPFFQRLEKRGRVILITDEHVESLHALTVVKSIKDVGVSVDVLVIESGETSKSIDVASSLWEKMLQLGADRDTAIIAVGGGVVGDLAGFVAATFARGLAFMQVPTTLLAQVDSSVGGKVGINLPAAKNMVGAFWQPESVLIDIRTLDTLPDREFRSGLAEVVKYGVILDEVFFEYLEQNIEAINDRDAAVLQHIVVRCCELKAEVVGADERETTGVRAALNYGHTFAHAFEALSGYGKMLHGEAVSIGMQCAARLAMRLGRIDERLISRQYAIFEAIGLPTAVPNLEHDQILELMIHDKKVQHGQLRFVLPDRLGHVELLSDIRQEDVRTALLD